MSENPIRMIMIDDKNITSDLDRAGYRSMGVFVRYCPNFIAAQELIKKGNIDILVINADYNKADYVAITRHFKNNPQTSDLPIIVTSVQSKASIRNSALEAGADLFIEQPIPRQYFIEKMKKLLDQLTRSDDRIELPEPVTLHIDGESFEYPIKDISTSGMLIICDQALSIDSHVTLSFKLPDPKKTIKVEGTIVRCFKSTNPDEPNAINIGIRFDKFSGKSQQVLEDFIAKNTDQNQRLIYYL